MRRYFLSAVVICAVSLVWVTPVHAVLNTWTNAVSGSWSDASKWTGGVPTGTDSATFNKPGTYTVNFSNVFQSLSDMFVTSGTVTFERVMSPATLTIIAAGFEDNLTVGGATLNMGQTSPVNITVAGETFINSGGTINVNVGSLLNGTGFDLHVNGGGTLAISGGADAIVGKFADIGSTTSSVGTVTVTGVGSTFTANTSGSIFSLVPQGMAR